MVSSFDLGLAVPVTSVLISSLLSVDFDRFVRCVLRFNWSLEMTLAVSTFVKHSIMNYPWYTTGDTPDLGTY